MPKTVTRAAILAVEAMLLAGMAAAQAPSPPFPRARDAATVAAWLRERTSMPLAAVVVGGPDTAIAVLPIPGQSLVPESRRVRVLQEVVDPVFASTLGGRSAVLELDVDCARRQVLRRSFDIYAGSNLTGAVERLGAGRAWSVAERGTPMAAIVSAACTPEAAPRPLATVVAAAEPPPARVLAVPASPRLPPPGTISTARAAPIRTPPSRLAPSLAAASPAPAAPAPALAPAPTAAPVRPAPGPATGPAPMVVLGEFASLEAARAAWAAAGAPGKVQRIELTSGRFRALVDGYASAPEAEAACAAIKGRGGRCSLR